MIPHKHISLACEACQRVRKRCSGGHPCESCTGRNVECLYKPTLDGRTRAARKRKIADLESDSFLLAELCRTVQASEDEQVAEIISVIRNNTSLEDIKSCMKQRLTEFRLRRGPKPKSDDLHERTQHQSNTRINSLTLKPSPPRTGTRVLDIARLTDSPPYRVPASPWTTVTTDDTLVSHLVSVWLTWDKPFYNWIEEDLLLRDMRQQRIDSLYCSPFLVNALLAYACSYSDYSETRTQGGESSKLMMSFIQEAKRLLEADGDEPLLTKAQGLFLLYLAIGITGKDGIGYEYGRRAASMCQTLERGYAHINTDDAADPQYAFSQALDTTCWGIFNIMTLVSITYQKGPDMQPPTRSIPRPLMDSHAWTPYPRLGRSSSAYSRELLHNLSGLSLVVLDLSTFLQKDGNSQKQTELDGQEDAVLELYKRLSRWRVSLPNHLQLSSHSPPSVLTHQAYYLSATMNLCAYLKKRSAGTSLADFTRAYTTRREAALEVVHICRTWQSLWGNSHVSLFVAQPVILALYALLEEEDMMYYRSEITDLCIFFTAASQRFPRVLAALRMFRVNTEQDQNKLPPETERLFEEFETEDWEKSLLKQVLGLYRSKSESGSDEESETQGITDLFAMMDHLDIKATGTQNAVS